MNQLLNAITCNDTKKLVKPTIWNVLANLANLLPFICLAVIVGHMYLYFETGEMNRRFCGNIQLSIAGFDLCYVCYALGQRFL